MGTEKQPISDKDLWRSLATGRAGSVGTEPAAVSDLDFAAWLEGRLDATQAARVEAAVANDAEMRRAALELADILGRPLPAPPERVAVRARALVGFAAERAAPRRAGLFDWLFTWDRQFAVQRAVAFSAAVVVAISGFLVGGGFGEQAATQRYASTLTQTRLASATTTTAVSGTSELTDFLASDGL